VPRSNRYILPGHIYHLTQRCHNRELMGIRKRYRLLDVDRLLSLLGTEDAVSFRKNLNAALELAIEKRRLERDPRWTESLAVGSEAFVKEVQERLDRRRTAMSEAGGAWTLRETPG
jgi:putative transposase